MASLQQSMHCSVLMQYVKKSIFTKDSANQIQQDDGIFIPLDNFLLKEDVLDLLVDDHSLKLVMTELSSSSFASKEFL